MNRPAASPRRLRQAGVAALLGASIATLSLLPASAHAVKTAGPYTLAIGWGTEPAYVGFDNTVEVIVTDQAGKPVDDLQPGALKVQVGLGGDRSDGMDLAPAFDPDTNTGTPGDYDTPLIPTAPGAYTFHVTGSVHGTAVDQSITASDQTFAVVVEPSDAQFPAKLPSAGAMSQQLERTASRAAAAQKAADDASGAANRALIVAIVALLAGVVLGGGASALARRRRA
jgi:hypothetical protein